MKKKRKRENSMRILVEKWLRPICIGAGVLLAIALLVVISAMLLPLKIENVPSQVIADYGKELPSVSVSATWAGREVDANVHISGHVDTSVLGTYKRTVIARFLWFTARQEQTVEVVDREKPVITLQTVEGSYTLPGHEYMEEGFTATDNYDGDITDQVKIRKEKETIIYSVQDSSGNYTEVCRVINYQDYDAPVISLKGDAAITIMAGATYTEPGFTATDNADGDVTDKVVVNANYSTYVPGTYKITYTVSDTFGNETVVARKLTVKGRTNPSSVVPDGKVIYLTFDDGPSYHTPRLLDVLAKYNVKATFFVVGTAAIGYIDDIHAGGHTVALHTNTHDFKSVYSSVEGYYNDLYAVQNKVYNATGVRSNLIRFPGGSSNTISRSYCKGIMSQLTKSVEAMGFSYFDWNVDSYDAGGAHTSEQVFNNVVKGVKGKRWAVVLQHDIHGFSVDAVESIIQWGLANGYTFLPLTSTSPTAHHGVNN